MSQMDLYPAEMEDFFYGSRTRLGDYPRRIREALTSNIVVKLILLSEFMIIIWAVVSILFLFPSGNMMSPFGIMVHIVMGGGGILLFIFSMFMSFAQGFMLNYIKGQGIMPVVATVIHPDGSFGETFTDVIMEASPVLASSAMARAIFSDYITRGRTVEYGGEDDKMIPQLNIDSKKPPREELEEILKNPVLQSQAGRSLSEKLRTNFEQSMETMEQDNPGDQSSTVTAIPSDLSKEQVALLVQAGLTPQEMQAYTQSDMRLYNEFPLLAAPILTKESGWRLMRVRLKNKNVFGTVRSSWMLVLGPADTLDKMWPIQYAEIELEGFWGYSNTYATRLYLAGFIREIPLLVSIENREDLLKMSTLDYEMEEGSITLGDGYKAQADHKHEFESKDHPETKQPTLICKYCDKVYTDILMDRTTLRLPDGSLVRAAKNHHEVSVAQFFYRICVYQEQVIEELKALLDQIMDQGVNLSSQFIEAQALMGKEEDDPSFFKDKGPIIVLWIVSVAFFFLLGYFRVLNFSVIPGFP